MKKTLALVLAAVMLLSLLSACKSSADETPTVDPAETEQTTTPEETTPAEEQTPEEPQPSQEELDQAAADNVAALIDAIYVQSRTDETDAQCEAAKAAWDALTDAQKELVEGDEASPDYFGLDTGDAEKGAHGIEERGVYRIHQFEKQEMIVVCKPEDSKKWYEQMWQYSVELFRSLDIPVRQLECCSGDLADLKCKSCDIEAWSPRQQKYFEVCSCSNLGDAQARRLKIRYKDADGKMQLCHTLNNTVVAPPRMLIALLENNLQADGSVLVPKVLQPYMGGKDRLVPRH